MIAIIVADMPKIAQALPSNSH